MLGNEDTEIQERIHKLGKLVFYTPRAVVRHHVPVDRMTKQYFYNRAYGNGRSEAILMARSSGRAQLLKQTLQLNRRLLAQCVHPRTLARNMIKEESRFGEVQFIAHWFGFLYQTVGLLFQGNTRGELS